MQQTKKVQYLNIRNMILFQKHTKAPQAAGRIHTDFEKGFIMAEVMKFDDFKQEGSEAGCKVRLDSKTSSHKKNKLLLTNPTFCYNS